ncbi:MAG: nitronate monooxygenase [Victivallales bacterium]|nr:nitronate monooxygenase [Victivallales bacterium]
MNLITISPAYHAQLAALLGHPVPYVVFAGGIPKDEDIGAVKETGAKVMCFAPTAPLAKHLVSAGADALVLEGREAGGHVGPVALNILLQQILFLDLPVPVFVAGGLWTGRLCAHLFLMGAAGVQLGTRFAASTDSCAHERFKQAYLEASARDAVVTPQFDKRIPVAPVRALRNEACEEFDRLQMELIGRFNIGELSREQTQAQLEQFWTGGLRRAVQCGDVASGSVMAGQTVGLVSRLESVHDILTDMLDGIETELQAVQKSLDD